MPTVQEMRDAANASAKPKVTITETPAKQKSAKAPAKQKSTKAPAKKKAAKKAKKATKAE